MVYSSQTIGLDGLGIKASERSAVDGDGDGDGFTLLLDDVDAVNGIII